MEESSIGIYTNLVLSTLLSNDLKLILSSFKLCETALD